MLHPACAELLANKWRRCSSSAVSLWLSVYKRNICFVICIGLQCDALSEECYYVFVFLSLCSDNNAESRRYTRWAHHHGTVCMLWKHNNNNVTYLVQRLFCCLWSIEKTQQCERLCVVVVISVRVSMYCSIMYMCVCFCCWKKFELKQS